jgi:hypothetical protein
LVLAVLAERETAVPAEAIACSMELHLLVVVLVVERVLVV